MGTGEIFHIWLPFASVRLGLDFAQHLCHNVGHHQLAAGLCPAHNNRIHADTQSLGGF